MNVFEKIREKLEELKTYKLNLADAMSELMNKDKLDHYVSKEEVIAIVNQVEQEHNNGWIPCSERLPTEHECVFVSYLCDEEVLIRMACYDNKIGWQVYENDYLGEVIAWQHLPQPYKEREDE